MTTRWEVEKAVLWSELKPPARLLALALLTKSDNDTAVVAAEHAPSLSTLKQMTGLSLSAVKDWLNALEDAGWVKRTRRLRGRDADRTTYALLVGAQTAALRTRTPGDVSGSGRPPHGLGRHTANPRRPQDGQGVGRDAAEPRPPHGHATTNPPPPKTTTKVLRGSRIPEDFEATPEMIAWAREKTPNVGAAETEAFIDYWRGKPGREGVKLDWLATWRNWMRTEQKRIDRSGGRPRGTHQTYRNPADISAYHGEL